MKRNGVKIIKSNVKEILASLAGDRLGQAVMAGGFVLEAQAKMKAPVDTGNLVNSISTELVSSDETSAFAQVGTGVVYAEAVEFGASVKNGYGKGIPITLPAQPYMRPAWDENIESIKATIERWAKKSVEGAAS
jgi:HK97 gp10 family phage protein